MIKNIRIQEKKIKKEMIEEEELIKFKKNNSK